ncbi:MAG: efflux RND transporter periplasmic adaptor subunit [Proteobacteria bacterium]|uniref:efflux RND transporter periplasmic adaptor subunit n=1 Tax=Aquabacterium sp. TaxID=1872578 RepID=UPI0035C71701|nr:efflux RND transporter periplasmic adaptor subunit [Pseudomonadota bacterium]
MTHPDRDPSAAHPPGDAAPDTPVRDSGALRRATRLGLGALALLLAGAGVRAYVNEVHASQIEAGTRERAVRSVLFTLPQAGQAQRSVALPATLKGRNEAAIHARTNGYVRAWKKDIGDRVRQGDVLALIDTPEVDQDLAQARAVLSQVQARLVLAQSSLTRWEGLRQRDAVSAQELDERRAAQQQAQADLAAAQANVRRLQQLHDFGILTAPFDGVVVRRNVEVGALVVAGGAATRELFYLAQSDVLRLTVAVPQAHAADIQVGKEVGIKLLERPQRPFKGRVTRVSGGLDVATRSLQVEVAVPNEDGQLLPGTYVEVSLPLSGSAKALLVPPNTLQFRQDGPRVAVLDADDTVSLRPVKLGRDLGRAVEVTSGLGPKDRVVLNPPDTIDAGERVRAKLAQAPSAPGSPASAASSAAPSAASSAASSAGGGASAWTPAPAQAPARS